MIAIPLSSCPQEGAKTRTETAIVRHRLEELVTDIFHCHLIDDAVPVEPRVSAESRPEAGSGYR
jgi:hypothetical protein